MIELREYQQQMVSDIRRAITQGKKRVCAVLGCGGGKSCVIGEIIRLATTRKNNNVLFLVHRKELISQIYKTLALMDVDFTKVQLYMVQTATRNLNKMQEPKLIICDESHHILSNSYKRIINTFPKAVVCGFTATPIRMNEGGLGEVFDCLVEGVSTQWLIDNHYLAPFKAYSIPLADTNSLHVKRGEFDPLEVEELMNKGVVFGDTVKNWKYRANDKKTIVYCSSIVTSKATAQEFINAGISAAHIDGTTPKLKREQIVQDFRAGKIKVLCNVDLFGEGFDVPDCECVVMLRPTKSLTLHIQQSMRSMRYQDGKTALILDHVGNFHRHGLPTTAHEWSLATKRKKKNEVHIKECPNCMAVLPSNARVCNYCGFDFAPSEQERERQRIEATLEEYRERPPSNYRDITTFEGLTLFCKAHEYKFYWCIYKAIELGIDIPPKFRWLEHQARRKLEAEHG